jgi:hypothetical protein
LTGWPADDFWAFPPPLEAREIEAIRIIWTGPGGSENGHNTEPTVTAKVTGFKGPPKRIISEPLRLKSLVNGVWADMSLVGDKPNRTVDPTEILLLQFDSNTNSITGRFSLDHVMVQVIVR